MPIRTLAELFLVAAAHDKPDCILHKVEGRYRPISSRELTAQVRQLTAALGGLGVARGERVALMADNGPHWPAVDFATLCLGAVLVPVYPTLLPEDAAYIVRDSGAKVLFVQGRERFAGLHALLREMPSVTTVALIEAGATPDEGFTTLEALAEQGRGAPAAEPAAFERGVRAIAPEDLATFIYTSGTTGKPKGVMLSHRNITSNVLDALQVMDILPSWTALSFLPLSHSFERTVDYILFYRGVTVAYAESIQAVARNIAEVGPHFFVAVPRVYEKVLSRVWEQATHGGGLRSRLFEWSVGVGREALRWRLREESPPGMLGVRLAIADRLVFSKLRARLGGRLEFAMSGGAPLGREVAEFFWSAGIRIFEGYGLTETSPVLTVNGPGRVRLGTVGRAIPEVELRIARDGEILARGPNVMQGYFGDPAATAEAIDAEGWFHTGDIGNLDADGFLTITDRKKELIVNAYGKNVAPAPIENELKASRFIAQAVVLGDKRKFLTALIVPDFETLRSWADSEGLGDASEEELAAHPRVRELLAIEIESVNLHLARFERIQAWEVLSRELTLEAGELTPTQKVKRRVILDHYGEIIDRMYRRAEEQGS
ncbi:MAG TPA: long-chain fatty acid--CoA ligase [Thermoanaerobaculia bacterium]|nr:long-chain fatty acid--CoA ligase [Thermoanaerobaculia bacterium]